MFQKSILWMNLRASIVNTNVLPQVMNMIEKNKMCENENNDP